LKSRIFEKKTAMIKIPYGISNFETLVSNDYIYIDRTPFIERLENINYRYIFFLRPRKFGKSLFLSTLDYYYNLKHKEKFDALFGQYYIGKKPTELANQYLTLQLDFSQIPTSSFEDTFNGFLKNTKIGAIEFYGQYPQFFNQEDIARIRKCSHPTEVIQDVIAETQLRTPHKIYLLIDEYDHFANEILSFRFDDFLDMVGRNGFVRKFYEAIKVGTQKGVIDRMFVTGISPITLDSLTSGFNISTNISLEQDFNLLMGFEEKEVIKILEGIEVPKAEMNEVLVKMKSWYNGYKFNVNAKDRVYNSNMILYFAASYSMNRTYPTELLDPNIASDYNKIRKSFKIKGQEKENLVHLNTLVETGELKSNLVHLFDLEKQFGRADFISLLYYQGIITIYDNQYNQIIFRMPNYVIEQLYFQYFHQVALEQSNLDHKGIDVTSMIIELADNNNMLPLVEYTENILQELAVRDKQNFNEKYIKTIFTSAFYISNIYTIKNELEVKIERPDKGFVDLLLLQRPPYFPKYQFAIEFKYIKKQDADKFEIVKEAAIHQLKGYLKNDEYLKDLKNLKSYVVIFIGNEGQLIEVFKE
jgi:hypothetical protein